MDPADVHVETMTEAEFVVARDRALADLGVTYDELAAMAPEEDFSSEEARLLWLAIKPLVR